MQKMKIFIKGIGVEDDMMPLFFFFSRDYIYSHVAFGCGIF